MKINHVVDKRISKFSIAVFSIAGLFFILYVVWGSSGRKEKIIEEKQLIQDTTIVLESSGMEEAKIPKKTWDQDTSIVLENGIYTLELRTIILKDTLAEAWEEYGFLSPFISAQYLVFYKNDEMIRKYEVPIEKVIKKTRKKKRVSLVSVPVYEICLLKGNDMDVYGVYGSNFCFGVLCPEFTGLYTMEGKMISEYIVAKNYFSGENITDFLTRNGIDENDPVKCNSMLKDFIIEE